MCAWTRHYGIKVMDWVFSPTWFRRMPFPFPQLKRGPMDNIAGKWWSSSSRITSRHMYCSGPVIPPHPCPATHWRDRCYWVRWQRNKSPRAGYHIHRAFQGTRFRARSNYLHHNDVSYIRDEALSIARCYGSDFDHFPLFRSNHQQ